jgi:hypothetical protein
MNDCPSESYNELSQKRISDSYKFWRRISNASLWHRLVGQLSDEFTTAFLPSRLASGSSGSQCRAGKVIRPSFITVYCFPCGGLVTRWERSF